MQSALNTPFKHEYLLLEPRTLAICEQKNKWVGFTKTALFTVGKSVTHLP